MALILSAVVSNVFEDISTTPQLSNDTASYPAIVKVMDKLPYFVLLVSALILIALYAKGRFGGSEL